VTETGSTRGWPTGHAGLGGWCSSGNPFVCEVIARAGYDFVILDAQHGLFDQGNLLDCIVALEGRGATPVVRVAVNDSAVIGKTLDLGAHAVIVPMVQSGADAERAVRACRYHPNGDRSFGPLRASFRLGRDPLTLAQGASCIVMIETADAVEQVDEITRIPGLGGVFIGPADLAITYGLPPSGVPIPGVHADAMARVRDSCLAAGVPVGLPAANAQVAAERRSEGYSFVSIGSDVQWIGELANTNLTRLKDTAAP
jgi:4-hydroxy-2-oxoheptanedioate aldolase